MRSLAPSIHRLTVGVMATNCYLVTDPVSRETLIVDPGEDAEYIADTVVRLGVRPTMILATHGHFDHILAAFALQHAFSIPCAVDPDDFFLVRRMRETAAHFLGHPVVDPPPTVTPLSEIVALGEKTVRVHKTPGHTPGSVCLLVSPSTLLVGDTLFYGGGVGSTDHSYGNQQELMRSIGRILSFSDRTALLPGHGDATTVGSEKRFHVQ